MFASYLLHAGNEHLHALQSEPLLRRPLLGEESLKPDGPGYAGQQQPLLHVVECERARSLQPLSDPDILVD